MSLDSFIPLLMKNDVVEYMAANIRTVLPNHTQPVYFIYFIFENIMYQLKFHQRKFNQGIAW